VPGRTPLTRAGTSIRPRREVTRTNQLARKANATGEFPTEAREALKHIRSVAMRIDDAIDGLM
jgi:hypothetical protein